jgi:hypothetical protein
MQIAGSTCSLCGKKIVFAQNGKCCPDCGIMLHEVCESRPVATGADKHTRPMSLPSWMQPAMRLCPKAYGFRYLVATKPRTVSQRKLRGL